MQVLGIFLFFVGVITFCYFIFREVQEINFLTKILREIIHSEKIKSVNDLIAIKNYLNKNIVYNSNLKTKKRPLLRHTASQILQTNYGFCGENARVAIKLLILGGVKAARIYLYGKKWGHVVVEQQWENKWYLFDGHYDSKTQLQDKDVSVILSRDIANYPNGYPENDYVDFCRIKLFQQFSLLKFLAKIRLPLFIIYYFESPYLMKASLGLLFTFIGVLFYYLS